MRPVLDADGRGPGAHLPSARHHHVRHRPDARARRRQQVVV